MATPSFSAISESAAVLLAGTGLDSAAPLLCEAGYPVHCAVSGAALLRLVRATPRPRLILLGETVGDQPGLMLLSRLVDDAAARHIPILFASDGGDEELAMALGARDCLSLPLRPLVLLARVQAHVRLAELAEVAD